MQTLRIFYIGQLSEGGTCLERMRALQRFGHAIVPFDITPWTGGGHRILLSLAHRFNMGPNVSRLNKALLDHCRTIGKVDLIWVDKGKWLSPHTLLTLKRRLNCASLHFTPDPQLYFHKSRHLRRCVPLYEWLVTTKRFEIEAYEQLGARSIIIVLQGYDRRFLGYSANNEVTWSSDVCFVGHFEKHYASRVLAASRSGCRMKVWGPGWVNACRLKRNLKPYVKGNGVWGSDYLKALANAAISLGLLSKWIPETSTSRSFEIPAIGTFLLAERTEEHQALFDEGKEAEFFASDEELRDKVRFYLGHDEARRRIARAGRERCIRSDYSTEAQLRKVLQEVTDQ